MKRSFLVLGFAVLSLIVVLPGCGGGGDGGPVVVGPGLVGIDDDSVNTAPLLRVDFTVPPSNVVNTVNILSDLASDGDIRFDSVLNTFTVTTSPPVVFFGFDSLSGNRPEFRTFLTFPLDGSTGQPSVPGDALIVLASVQLFVNEVSFASTVPTFFDLVQYPIGALAAADFNSVPIDFRTLNFFGSDVGNFVDVDITPFMQQAQVSALLDLQLRFLVDTGGALAPSRGPAAVAPRTVRPSSSRALDNITSNRGTSAPKPRTETGLPARSR